MTPLRRLDRAVPMMVSGAPLVAFGVGGTVAAITPTSEEVLTAAVWPVLAGLLSAAWVGSRFARTVAAVALVTWWAGYLWALVASDQPLSAFGELTIASLPVLVAWTWAKPWGTHDLEERR